VPDTTSPTTRAASILATRRRQSEQGPALPLDCRPTDIESALAIQADVTRQLDVTIAGWKCALPAEGRIIAAPVYTGSVYTGSPCRSPARNGQVRIEPELAFLLGHDLPPREVPYTEAEIDAAIERTHIALELIGSRYSDPTAMSYEEHLADGLLNQGLFIGPRVDDEAARLAGSLELLVTCNTETRAGLHGIHPNGSPRLPLYWLAEFLRTRGIGLQAGQAVITGSYAGSIEVPVDQDIVIRFGSLGELAVRFEGQ
jgi:2-keto-4-pentenoate hydratase